MLSLNDLKDTEMTNDVKEDGLCYAYRYRLRTRKWDKWSKSYKWHLYYSHYDKKDVFETSETQMAYPETFGGIVVEEYFDGQWIVCMEWLEKYKDNNRHNLTWECDDMYKGL